MPALALFLAAASLTVKSDGTALRAECDGEAVARLAAATPVKVRFGLGGCYAVELSNNGATVTGFLAGHEIAGIDTWEESRRSAPGVGGTTSPRFERATGDHLAEAARMMAANRPADALAMAERGLIDRPRDPQLLGIAGLAALENDMAASAVGYLKDALAIRPDPALDRALERAGREHAADRSGGVLHSSRFQFRYDPRVMPTETARALLQVLDQEYARISFELGCNTAERIAVVAQTRDDYLRATGAAEWSGAQFDGRIRVAMLEDDPGGALTRRTFAHELVHACLAATGNWPAWFHEGLAQKLSGEVLTEPKRVAIRAAAKLSGLPKLQNLSQSWSRMSAGHAAMAYAAALYAMELFYEHHQAYGIRNLIRNPEHLDRIADDLDGRLRQ